MKRSLKEDELSRRQFVWQSACAAVGAVGIASTVWDLRLINAAMAAAGATDYKALVCVFMYGGNDSNQVLVPTDSTTYAQYSGPRPLLALPTGSVLPLSPLNSDGHTYGIHPSLTGLKTLFDNGHAAILRNVGTLARPTTKADYTGPNRAQYIPPQLFSHNDQQVLWQTSVTDVPSRTGWGGRCADLLNVLNDTGSKVSMSISLAGSNTFEIGNVVNQYSVSTTGSPTLSSASSSQLNTIKSLIALNHSNLFEKSYANVTNNAIVNGALLNTAIAPTASAAWPTTFPTSSLGQQLQMVARLIAARTALGHHRQIFFVSLGGFDTHNGQVVSGAPTTGTQAGLLQDLSDCMKAFYDATTASSIMSGNVSSMVTAFTASDFTRTLQGNDGVGSDHGWGGHHFITGGAVVGKKLYGTFETPLIGGPDDTSLGRWIPTTSVDEYSGTLAKWFGVSPSDLNTVFPNLSRFANPDLGFLTAT